MAYEISNSEDIIDVRNVIERVEELRSEIEDETELLGDHPDEPSTPARQTRLDNIEELRAELAPLESLLEDLAGYGGDHQWEGQWYPVSLIRDSYFEDHARELAEDIGGSDIRNASWPFNCIDWQKAAEQLQQDYSSVEFGGVTYWYR